jgi:UDP:flavonoid glycosyltransferase YjiC (YdhE family)
VRVTIITIGSRGDAQPYVALAAGLARRGHRVTVATHEIFRPLVLANDIDFAPVAGDPAAIVAAADRWMATGRGRDALSGLRYFLHVHGPLLDALLADYWRSAQGSDLLIYSTVAFPASSVAERLGIPGIAAGLQPLHRTRAFPFIGAPAALRLGPTFNEATYAMAGRLVWSAQRRRVTAWRRDVLGLPPSQWRGPFARLGSPAAATPTIYGYSPSVVSRPADWDPHVRVTGYWPLRPGADWRPPPALERFLDAGPPPVSIGFGSMTPQHANRLTAIAVDALALAGHRGILLSGWGNLGGGPLPSTIFTVQDVPHEWLFPRMRAIVHHGGAGTTGAALRSGVPSVVVPLGFDQPYWGRRVEALGVGPGPIPRRKLTVARLAHAIDRAVSDHAMRERSEALGRQLRSENGVDSAVDVVEEHGSRPAAAEIVGATPCVAREP